jgi:hypothetical protein
MKWKSIRNCGKTKEEFKKIQLNEGKIKTGEFLNETVSEFARVSTQIFDTIGDFAFTYKERQLSSIFLPAFFNLGYGAIQEVPTRRRERGQESSHGWLDYWVQKDEKWVYLIELKHGWQFLNGKITENSYKKISESIDQLKNIRKPEIKELSTVETTYKISFIVLPVWRNINREEDIHEDDEYPTSLAELEKTSKNIIHEIGDAISWLGIWSIPERMQYAFQPSHTKKLQTFSGVIFIATIVP